MRRTLAVARAEWIHNLRDPRSLFVILALPVLLLLLYGYGINYDLRDITFAVYDLDDSEVSRDIIQSFIQSGYFKLTEVITDDRRVRELLDGNRVVFVLVLPPNLQGALGAGRPADVQVLINGVETTRASAAQGYIDAALARYSQTLIADYARRQSVSPPQALTVHSTILYNPGLSSSSFIVPGLIAILVAILSALLTSTAIVREREWGSFETLVTSPVQAPNIMIGKILPYVAIAFVDVLLSVLTGVLVFHVVPVGSVALLLGVSFLYLLASLATGILFSTVARTQQLAILVAMLSTLLPTILLSGFVFPIRSMPLPLRIVSQFLPPTHFLIVIRTIYLKGGGLAVLWPQVLILALFAFVLVTLAAKRFKKRL
ncbi:MAG: ABC transporter permease [Armatimonadia bacterium]